MPAPLAEIDRRLWDSAEQLRADSGLRTNEYSVPVLGMIFPLSADDKFARAEAELQGSLPPGSRRTLDMLLPKLIGGQVDVEWLNIGVMAEGDDA